MTEAHLGLDRDALRARIGVAIEHLPRLTRTIFLLSRLDDLTYDDIGWRCGVSVDEVTNRMGAALYQIYVEAVDEEVSVIGTLRPTCRQWRAAWASYVRQKHDRRLGIGTRR
ncbi:hypothetical protein ACFB49_31150 [Sphingomonas sp. DBB INV C78]|uniref:sigma-70 region 4 domain-containing protein n=1 Tax=Sphingomonas sp. DBB INV C78 TaxID=3349434 RepID=UPI0036D3BB0D